MTQPREKNGRFAPPKSIQWYINEGARVGYFDLEFSNLKADWGYITAWCIKERDTNYYDTAVITRPEIMSKNTDKRLVERFSEAVKGYDLLVGYYSSMADVPYLRARFMNHRIPFIPYHTKNHLDLYFALRGKLAISSKSLKNMTHFLGIDGKVDVQGPTWTLASLGDPKALKIVAERNRFDCSILEELHKKFEGMVKFNKNWI